MSNRRKTRRHPGSDMITVAWIAEERWQAAGSPADIETWLGTLTYSEVEQTMMQTEVTRDEFLRRMAGHPDLVRQASTADGLFIMLAERDVLRQWWASAPGRT